MQAASSSSAGSFASILAGLTAPKTEALDPWNDEALADDVATLSYEQALRTHSRSRSSPASLPAPPAEDSRPTAPAAASAPTAAAAGPACRPLSLEENRKTASITIRLSHAECEQLRQRAAAAGLSVSAYLRSCIFEVENLRSQVKNALAELRSDRAAAPQPMQQTFRPGRSWSADWLGRLFTRWHRTPRIASA